MKNRLLLLVFFLLPLIGYGIDVELALLEKAKNGDTKAQYKLAEQYFENQEYEKAVYWLKICAEQGGSYEYDIATDNFILYDGVETLKAKYILGSCYHKGFGVKQDYNEAKRLYTLAAENGLVDAQLALGHYYFNGYTGKKNYEEALSWFLMAAEKDNPDAQYYAGDSFYYGYGTNIDYKEAAKWYLLAADQDHAEAQNALGHCYAMGEGVPYDMNEAEKWWQMAADKGNIEAQMALQNLEEERTKGINPPPSLPTLLTGVSSYSTEYVYEENNQRSEEELADEIRKALEDHLTTKVEAPKLKVLTDEQVTFSDTRQEVRFAISDASHTIKYRIDGGATATLSAQEVKAGVCEIELPQRDCMLTMWCVGGEPHMIRYCYDREESVRKSSTLYILAIGLNDYQDPNLGNLRYAEKDARDVIEAISKKHRNTFANIDAQLLVGRDVTSSKISEKINYLADKATASDMAVIFFAGHGLVDERDRYYLSTYNITDASTPRRGGYSSSTFVEDISYINCKLLVFIDACYSGKLLEGYRGSVSSENFFREMNSTPNGTCIYTSSSKDVKSRESAEHKHGIFTQALIESFEFDKSDHDKDNRITVIEVRNYLEKRIPQLTGNKQKPIYRNIEEIDFPLFIK